MIDLQGLIQVLADSFFGGNTLFGGIVILTMVMLVVVALTRNAFVSLLISLPVTFVFSSLNIIPQEMMILMIIVAVLGLAYTSRNIWRD